MKKVTVYLVLSFMFSLALYGQKPWEQGKLKAADNGHYLVHEDGTPFFWLGDTGWEMLCRLNREETAIYLDNRKSKGFNVIQTVLVSEFIHSDKATNFYGDSIFVNENPEKPFVTKTSIVPRNTSLGSIFPKNEKTSPFPFSFK